MAGRRGTGVSCHWRNTGRAGRPCRRGGYTIMHLGSRPATLLAVGACARMAPSLAEAVAASHQRLDNLD